MKTKTKKNTTLHAHIKHHAKHLLVPHKGNHYRPHLVRLHGVTAVLVIALLVQVVYGYITAGRFEILGRVSNISASDLLKDTNEERKSDGLPALTMNAQLNDAAFMKARDMFANDYWAHDSPTGVTPWKWLGDVQYRYDIAGENLAKNYPTAQATVDAWMASPTHKANIMNDRFDEIGLAVVDGTLNGRPTTLVVAYYGSPIQEAVAGNEDESASPVLYTSTLSPGGGNPLAYFGTALQSLSPATLGSLGLLVMVGVVALAAHHYRRKLPVSWRRSWKIHHGMYTLVGMVSLGVLIVLATGGGQI